MLAAGRVLRPQPFTSLISHGVAAPPACARPHPRSSVTGSALILKDQHERHSLHNCSRPAVKWVARRLPCLGQLCDGRPIVRCTGSISPASRCGACISRKVIVVCSRNNCSREAIHQGEHTTRRGRKRRKRQSAHVKKAPRPLVGSRKIVGWRVVNHQTDEEIGIVTSVRVLSACSPLVRWLHTLACTQACWALTLSVGLWTLRSLLGMDPVGR